MLLNSEQLLQEEVRLVFYFKVPTFSQLQVSIHISPVRASLPKEPFTLVW